MPASSEVSGNGDLRAPLQRCRSCFQRPCPRAPYHCCSIKPVHLPVDHPRLFEEDEKRRAVEEAPRRELHEKWAAEEMRKIAAHKRADPLLRIASANEQLLALTKAQMSEAKERAAEAAALAGAASATVTQNGPALMTFKEFEKETDQDAGSLLGDALLVKGGGYLVLSGPTGVGKSILFGNLLAALGMGLKEFLGLRLPGRPVRFAILQAEGSRVRWKKRLGEIVAGMGGRLGDLPGLVHRREVTPSISMLRAALEHAGKELGGIPELVILDPVTRFFEGDDNKSDVWKREVTKPLEALAREFNVSFAISDHYAKPAENRTGGHKLRGTSAKLQDCGAGLRLEIGQGGAARRLLFFDRVRDGALPFSEEPGFDGGSSRLGLVIDVKAGTVRLDEEGAAAPMGETPKEQKEAKRREKASQEVQAAIEKAIRTKKPKPGFPGSTKRELARYADVDRRSRAFKDAIRALEAQKVIAIEDGPNDSECAVLVAASGTSKEGRS